VRLEQTWNAVHSLTSILPIMLPQVVQDQKKQAAKAALDDMENKKKQSQKKVELAPKTYPPPDDSVMNRTPGDIESKGQQSQRERERGKDERERERERESEFLKR
jgi:hypothetical protein